MKEQKKASKAGKASGSIEEIERGRWLRFIEKGKNASTLMFLTE